MKLEKRIKRIVSLTVEDFYNSGYSTDESPESLKVWLCDALMQDESIEDAHAYEISLKVLEMLNSLDMVDLELIHNIVLKEYQAKGTITIQFDGVRL
ncbi:hypothetical protein CVO_09430 [Sulfurimonas sp. CVO]|uniref:hypothetical protein n=1 Tax=Sulfurimonas sp. CVO TaxID=2283483 RepID=UPI00132ED806|nr:hypothetical protein [Sulfurimonas sp. CVO]QHG92025.1 hypothetical protein CVO_09430 [Sulfurimonas sp. CVO]